MSFIRAGYLMKYVEGISDDYVYSTERKGKPYVEDYGCITNEGLVEILCHIIDYSERFRNEEERKYFRKKLAEKLGVNLRKKPLSDKEWIKLVMKK